MRRQVGGCGHEDLEDPYGEVTWSPPSVRDVNEASKGGLDIVNVLEQKLAARRDEGRRKVVVSGAVESALAGALERGDGERAAAGARRSAPADVEEEKKERLELRGA